MDEKQKFPSPHFRGEGFKAKAKFPKGSYGIDSLGIFGPISV